MLFEETTRTLFRGDLFTHLGNGPAVTGEDLVERALQGEELFRQTSCLTAAATALRSLATLRPRTLAVMHGSSFQGDGAAALNALADALEQRFSPESDFAPGGACCRSRIRDRAADPYGAAGALLPTPGPAS